MWREIQLNGQNLALRLNTVLSREKAVEQDDETDGSLLVQHPEGPLMAEFDCYSGWKENNALQRH